MPKRQWTEEQRQAARERAKARWAQPPTVVAEAPPVEEDDAFGLLADVQKKVASKKAVDELTELLKQNPELLNDPAIEERLERLGAGVLRKAKEKGLPPGTVLGAGVAQRDIPWTLNDVNRLPDGSKELMTWTPNETLQVFYNGIMCQCIADETMTTEKAFFDVYMEHKRLQREGDQRKAWMFGKNNAAPQESGEAAVSMARVRAFMSAGGEYGGGRIVLGYPGDERFELREVPGGGQSGETPKQ